ncbi:MAG: hypothetical protein IJ306_09630 [Oscillospiraceae bacterium]|nr:hypothetical protein [Oscillospiraceae bacterium]
MYSQIKNSFDEGAAGIDVSCKKMRSHEFRQHQGHIRKYSLQILWQRV